MWVTLEMEGHYRVSVFFFNILMNCSFMFYLLLIISLFCLFSCSCGFGTRNVVYLYPYQYNIYLCLVLVVVGGQSPKAIRKVECYNFTENKWSVLADMPTRRCR